MKTYSTEILSRRINKLEEKLQRYIELQADLYIQVTEITECFEKIENTIKAIKQELQALKNHVKEWNLRVARSTR